MFHIFNDDLYSNKVIQGDLKLDNIIVDSIIENKDLIIILLFLLY